MKKLLFLTLILCSSVVCSCDEYVSNIEPYYNQTKDTDLNDQSFVNGFVTGLQNQLATTLDDVTMNADGLSDELLFDRRDPYATYPSYESTDKGTPLDGDEATAVFMESHELRQLADTLIYRISNEIAFTDSSLMKKGLFNGYLFGAYARYLLATYVGKDQTTGGSPVNLSRFIPSGQLYQDAIARWIEAASHTTVAAEKRVVNSLIARAYLFMGDYANAATYAQQGMVKNDAPFLCRYNATNDNIWRNAAGEVRAQWTADPRFAAYVAAEPTESARIQLSRRTGSGGFVYYVQLKYIMQPDKVTVTPIEVIDWQENNLMKAELVVRGAMAGDALALINEIRASRLDAATKAPVAALAAGTTISLVGAETATTNSIYVERDKELFLRGNRLVDQRRFGTMHIAGMWQYFPVSVFEKNRNPLWNQ